jgi:hypothetical protein
MSVDKLKENLYQNLTSYLDELNIGDESAIDTIVIGVCDVIDETFKGYEVTV